MANYIGLQGIFNALAGGGANAVNVYAQEKDRQRRLAFDEKKFSADQAYRKQVLDQDQQRIKLASRQQHFVENKWQHLQDQKRREEVVDLQYRLAGNLRAMALERGYETPRDMAKAGDADAMNYFNSGIQNLARYTTNKDLTTELVEAGTDEAGDKLFTIRYSDGGKNRIFGGAATLDDIAGKVNAFNLEVGIPVFADRNGMAIDYDKNGKAMLVNKEGKPELSSEQQQAAAELDQQIKDQTGRSLQETLDNPVLPEVKAELDGQEKNTQGNSYTSKNAPLSFDSIVSGGTMGQQARDYYTGDKKRTTPYDSELIAKMKAAGKSGYDYDSTPEGRELLRRKLGRSRESARQIEQFGKSVLSFAKKTPERIEGYLDEYGEEYDKAGSKAEGAGRMVHKAATDLVDTANENLVQPVKSGLDYVVDANRRFFKGVMGGGDDQGEKSFGQTTSADPAPTAPVSKPPTQPAKAQEQIVSPKTSPKRRAAIFANQMLAAGGKDAMGSVEAQKIYQALQNPETSDGVSADAARYMDQVRKERKVQADKNQSYIEDWSNSFSEGQLAGQGFNNPEDVLTNLRKTVARNKQLLAVAGIPGDIDQMNNTQLTRLLDVVEQSMRGNNRDKGFFSSGKTDTRGTLSNDIIPLNAEALARNFLASRTDEARRVMIEEAGSEDAALRQLIEEFNARKP